MTDFFKIINRNYGHWDIWDEEGRIFCIRGGPGSYHIRDERNQSDKRSDINKIKFNSVQACMAYICDILMYELIIAEGQEPEIIESWNID